MKRIETRDHEFVIQFRKTIQDSFPPALNFKIDYYLGEDKGVRGLYFILISRFGRIFTKIKHLETSQVVYDVEEEFMNEVINDLVMNGVTFLNMIAFESVNPVRVDEEIKAEVFNHTSPRKLLFIN